MSKGTRYASCRRREAEGRNFSKVSAWLSLLKRPESKQRDLQFKGPRTPPPPPSPLFLGFILKTIGNQSSFERYCAIRVVLCVWGKVALFPKYFWPPFSYFSGSAPVEILKCNLTCLNNKSCNPNTTALCHNFE